MKAVHDPEGAAGLRLLRGEYVVSLDDDRVYDRPRVVLSLAVRARRETQGETGKGEESRNASLHRAVLLAPCKMVREGGSRPRQFRLSLRKPQCKGAALRPQTAFGRTLDVRRSLYETA